ncbi:hypothetical protein CCACVL1_30599 [Corchorus capsularis]|uniref:Uncharacterized protein n=1 Tax=Corchorus capsularis TaxID=210143 RepID=A0A1R3FWD5_COCAP|nr:hypothetical protein CCACVL1_30599 [Corchorus capsularis]
MGLASTPSSSAVLSTSLCTARRSSLPLSHGRCHHLRHHGRRLVSRRRYF